ncbi:MAG: 13E12 repeat family protein [Actinomycetota bacterium]|nr:13E12 repeat family protein [Actinomycetota bacterium]
MSAKVGSLEAEAALHELSLATRIPVGSLQGALASSRFARSKLPTVWSAWVAGIVGAAHVGVIVDKAHRLQRPESLLRLDDEVVRIATERTVAQLRRWLARFADRTEPDLADRRHREARRERRVYVEVGDDGMSWLSALIPITEAAVIDQKLETLARNSGFSAGDVRTHEQKRADVFSDLILGKRSNGDTEPSGTASRIDIGVVVPIQSLMGLGDAPGELIDRSTSVPAAYIRSLATRPGTIFWRLLTDQRGNLLDVSRIGRFATGDLDMAIRFRDGTSVFPTSIVPAVNCDNDHTISFPGPTTASNLGALHRRAHRLKTSGHLSVRQPEPGVFEWTTSTGHIHTHRPEPLPTAEWDESPWFAPELVNAISQEINEGYGLAA